MIQASLRGMMAIERCRLFRILLASDGILDSAAFVSLEEVYKFVVEDNRPSASVMRSCWFDSPGRTLTSLISPEFSQI